MPDVGVRELKTHASEIVRNVRERRARYTITYRGQPVGVLMPLEQPQAEPASGEEAWDELVRLGLFVEAASVGLLPRVEEPLLALPNLEKQLFRLVVGVHLSSPLHPARCIMIAC